MTLKAVADELGTTTMTVYRRLSKAGISINDLRDSDTGELTSQGASVIASLFDADGTTQVKQTTQRDTTENGTSDATVQIAILTERLNAATDTISRLEAERDRLVRQLDTAQTALASEQADRAAERRLLTGGDDNGQQRREHWWRRLWRG